MTSLFEFHPPDMPVDLLRAGARGISLIEFFAVEEEAAARQRADSVAIHQEATPEAIARERAEQTRVMIDAARAEAVAETRRASAIELEGKLANERDRIAQVCEEFAKDRQRYFAAAESQVVRLALAIARRVLAREVAANGMHLEATVRAALERVQDGSATTIRVPEREMQSYTALFAKANVNVVLDASLAADDCVLETVVGRVELSVEVQLAEIERGFGELTRRHGE